MMPKRRMLWGFAACVATGLLLNGCQKAKSDGEPAGVQAVRVELSLEGAADAYAKDCFDGGQQPQPTISVKQLFKFGFLKPEDMEVIKNPELMVAVDTQPAEDFNVAAGDIEQVFVGIGSSSLNHPVPKEGASQVCIKLSGTCATALRANTKQNIGRNLRLRAGSITLLKARVASEIPGPWVVVSVADNIHAKEIAERLKGLARPKH